MDAELDQLYRRFSYTVFRRCLALLGDEGEAQDVTQDVFVKVLELGDVTIDSPSGLFHVIATRLCLNRLRSRRTRRTSPSDLLDQIAHAGPSTERISNARALLTRLFAGNADDARVIAVLHHVDGMTLEETAHELQLSVSTVRRRLRALRRDLKALEAPQ